MFSFFRRPAPTPPEFPPPVSYLDRMEDFHRRELQRCIDRPLIIVPNEWENPVVGFGKAVQVVGQSHILIVHNYISNQDVWCGGVRMDFSEQRLDVALALDPYQLWAITAHNAVGHENFDKPRSGERWPREKIMSVLHENGFFDRWQEFQSQEK